MTKRITLEGVAQLAGVSRATVSRVINDPTAVKPELRARVEKVIVETGYQPNLAARSLASSRSHLIGLIIPSLVQSLFTDPYFPSLIQGISQACNMHHYILSLFLFHSLEEEGQVYQRALNSGLVDGLIVTASIINNPYLPRLIQQKIPLVQIGRPFENVEQISFVDVDNVSGAYRAAHHLIRLGRKRIAFIGGTLNTTVGIDRYTGYCSALREKGLVVDQSLTIFADFTRADGYAAMQQIIPHHPDAVFVITDTMAVGALQALHEAGLRVPEDISVIGFDDLTQAASSNPPLTTVRQPVRLLGTMAVDMLIDILETGLHPPRHTILPTELIIRASCGTM
ncbi:MAG: LacI family DNA-binding transcriptional regulator [Chloroflexi bacterium]|nr:LacI family DNA-binding transcriptional regulator [Chloroflexota bacterium]